MGQPQGQLDVGPYRGCPADQGKFPVVSVMEGEAIPKLRQNAWGNPSGATHVHQPMNVMADGVQVTGGRGKRRSQVGDSPRIGKRDVQNTPVMAAVGRTLTSAT